MTFKAWIKRRRVDDRIGDLAEDIARDKTFPAQVDTLDALLGHMRRKNACLEAIETAKEAWEEYEATLRC